MKGDTFPLTWADDDNIYTSAGDPCWPMKEPFCRKSYTGLDFEKISGDAPNYKVEKVNEMLDYEGSGGFGPKPTGLISINGILYLAFQNYNKHFKNFPHDQKLPESQIWHLAHITHGYGAHIVASKDHGKTWTPNFDDIESPMFPERTFANPAFINFGKDNQNARDNYVYAVSGEGWDNGNYCRLGRVPNDKITDITAWEFVAGYDANHNPLWTNDQNKSIPILEHPGYLGYLDMTYIASIKRYLLLSWHFKNKVNPTAGSELIIYDAPEPWGPFTLAHHEDLWEPQEVNPYSPHIPLKWFNQQKLEGYLLFSGTWLNGGQTPHYRILTRKFKIKMK